MKSFRFDDLWLLSDNTARARHLEFSATKNLLVGVNHTGKSTVLRMLFHVFGCTVKPLGGMWDSGATAVVRFSLGETTYLMLRRGQMIALFNRDGTLQWVTREAGEVRDNFSNLFRFVLPLTSQNGEARQARPAFFFLPTFIDQDGSWLLTWDTFRYLSEYKSWQKPTIELALGIRTSTYWATLSDLNAIKKTIEDIKKEQQAFADAKKRLAEKFPRIPWFVNGLAFRNELKQLEEHAGSLAKQQNLVRDDCAEAASTRDMLRAQIHLIEDAVSSHNEDMRFLSMRRVGEDIICPTCGTAHEHSFFERLNLEAEADELRQMRASLAAQARRAEERLKTQEEKLAKLQTESDAIEELLGRTKGELKLREIIERAGRGTAYEALEEQSKVVDEKRLKLERDVNNLHERLRNLDDKKRVASIRKKFDGLYATFAQELDVPETLSTRKGEVHTRPREGGSGGPRAVLAYYFAISYIAAEYSDGYLPPLVIDSPHANAQDAANRAKMTRFILKNPVEGQQVILGVEDEPPDSIVFQSPPDRRLDLTEKYHLLQEEEYPQVLTFIEPLVRTAVTHLGDTLF